MKETKEKCLICGAEKNWEGGDIKCPFKNLKKFNPNNWNCGIINKIRDICDMAGHDERINCQWFADQHFCTINISDIVNKKKIGERGDIGLTLWVSWYKRRGSTEAMWVLGESCKPHAPTLDELKAIIRYYEHN